LHEGIHDFALHECCGAGASVVAARIACRPPQANFARDSSLATRTRVAQRRQQWGELRKPRKSRPVAGECAANEACVIHN
jgi:hypothetical protein